MRVMYIGMDGRTRVSKALRVRFLEDGLKPTDRSDGIGMMGNSEGPTVVVHLLRSKGGKRLVATVPDHFNMTAAERQLLQEGWIDLTDCTVIAENPY